MNKLKKDNNLKGKMDKSSIKLLRYPGGKQKMLKFLLENLPVEDIKKGRYIEPFVGGGAVFFAINPQKAILSDVNVELIDLYKALRMLPTKVWKIFQSYPSTKEGYYKIRDFHSKDASLEERAARTLYLNRTCFKGMWRHNSKGEFNVGYGGEDRRWAINKQNLLEVSQRLKKAWLRNSDFERIINKSKKGDFIFLDPPYKPGAKEMKHAHYQYGTFIYKDHIRLAKSLKKASERGVLWAMTTSSHPDILNLLSESTIIRVPKGTSSRLGIQTINPGEILICNYKINNYRNEAIFRQSSPSKSSTANPYFLS